MTSTELVSELQAYVDACSGPGITLYDGHPAVLIAKARDAITALERELDEARLAASVIEGICNEMYLELTDSQAQVERLKEELRQYKAATDVSIFVPWLRSWCKVRFGKWITHNTAKGALDDLGRAALQVEESKG